MARSGQGKSDGYPVGGKSGRGAPHPQGWESPRGTHVHRREPEPKHDGYPLGGRGKGKSK